MLEALERTRYDLVLMDCQMPEMDGYEATRKIRDPRSKVLEHDIPIIALTANVMKDARDECLEAGMDDYLAKPFEPNDLKGILVKWLSGTGQQEVTEVRSSMDDLTKIFDKEDLNRRLMGDEDLIAEIISSFLDDAPNQISDLKDALRNDSKTVRLIAHTIKGMAANVGATALWEIAFQVEQAGKEDDLETAAGLMDELNEKYIALEKVLTSGSET